MSKFGVASASSDRGKDATADANTCDNEDKLTQMFAEAARGLAMLCDNTHGKPFWRRTASGGLQPEPFRAVQVSRT